MAGGALLSRVMSAAFFVLFLPLSSSSPWRPRKLHCHVMMRWDLAAKDPEEKRRSIIRGGKRSEAIISRENLRPSLLPPRSSFP